MKHSFAKYIGAFALLASMSPIRAQDDLQPQPSCRIRREVRDLSSTELARFVNAIRRLHETQDGSNPWSVFEKFAKQHNDYAGLNHNSATFFPYHRKMLADFEEELMKVDPSVTLPYWNSTIMSQTPWLDPVLSPTMLGDGGRSGSGCIGSEGLLAGWSFSRFWENPNTCIRRAFTFGAENGQSTFFIWGAIQDVINNNPNYNDFRSTLEIYHGTPHVFVGGDMNTMLSPMDPIFWVHHAFIDAVWDVYQRRHDPNYDNYNGRRGDGREAQLSDANTPYEQPVSDVMNSGNICVRYAPSGDQAANVSVLTVKPPTIDERWVNMNGFDAGQVNEAKQTVNASTVKFQKMIDEAVKNGNGFVPGVGKVRATSSAGPNMQMASGLSVLGLVASALFMLM